MIEIAQLAADAVAPFAQWGIAGSLVAWVCLRVEKRLDRMEHTVRGLSMGILMDLSTRKVLAAPAQRMVDEMLRKLGAEPGDAP